MQCLDSHIYHAFFLEWDRSDLGPNHYQSEVRKVNEIMNLLKGVHESNIKLVSWKIESKETTNYISHRHYLLLTFLRHITMQINSASEFQFQICDEASLSDHGLQKSICEAMLTWTFSASAVNQSKSKRMIWKHQPPQRKISAYTTLFSTTKVAKRLRKVIHRNVYSNK